jgi:hypothetical protein
MKNHEVSEIVKEIGYYLRNEDNQPKTAVAIFVNDFGHTARGVSICSPKDQFIKKEGRISSRMRAYKALIKEDSFGKIRREGMLIDDEFLYKCEFMPNLTDFEKKLLEDPKSV